MKKYSILLFCIFVMIACSDDKDNGRVMYWVNNYSDFKLHVSYKMGKKNYLKDIYPFQNGQLYYNSNASTSDKGDQFLDVIDNLNISINDSFKITKDYLKRENWSYYGGKFETLGGGGYFSASYNFYVHNTDIEKIK